MNKELLTLIESKLGKDTYGQALSNHENISVSSLQSLAIHLSLFLKNNPAKRIALGFPTLFQLQTFTEFLSDLYDENDLYLFPKDEILRLGPAASSKEMAKERLRTLAALIQNKAYIVLFNSIAGLEWLENPSVFAPYCFEIKRGQHLAREALIQKLLINGYLKVDWVNGAFEFASRGSIVDIYSPVYDMPLRVEFDDEMVDDIRFFSPDTELRTKEVNEATFIPCSLLPVTKEVALKGQKKIEEEIKTLSLLKKDNKSFKDCISEIRTQAMQISDSLNIYEQQERLAPYYDFEKADLLDYLLDFDTYIINPEEYNETQESFKAEESNYLSNLRENDLALPNENIFQEIRKLDFKKLAKIEVNLINNKDSIEEIHATNRTLNESAQLLNQELNTEAKIYICLDKRNIPNVTNYLSSIAYGYSLYPEDKSKICIVPYPISKGFKISKVASFISSQELYGISLRRSRFLTRYKEFHPIKKYSDLKIGDYVVHEDNGIAIYEGLEEIDGIDYLKLKYAASAVLFVPVFQFNKIRKYAGSEAIHPTLDTIGGSTWARKKAKIRARLNFLTDKLLNIYAERESTPGISFLPDVELEKAFSDKFPFPLTDSQVKAWDAISRDMESPHPMDRLIAGDVGFGKTELAFKASFRAIENGYQAALLCPTTVLARQHFELAKSRFDGFGINIALLSRFNTSKELQQSLKDIRSGKTNLIIGTHRMLSNDVVFKNLGLLTVDEEQKFGVTQKERIKEITKNVDVLSLSATPIPRTLQMSLLSIKPMSTLSEPPSNRLPVKTYVVKENNDLIKEVIQRELNRNGQVYFLHNRIEDIYQKAGQLQKFFPTARIAVAHGRMDAQDIANIMNDFYDGLIDILVCTSIIESGLDVPNVNTIIIEDAQNFGLSTLYQIKGRVGRSNRLSYAYLFYSDYAKISDEGRERLKAIKDFAELGSGYKIAQRDLAIRGAGNILGKEQAGFIDSLGYESYTQLLSEVIKQKKAQEQGVKLAKEENNKSTRYLLSFTLDAHIPEDFASEGERINIYREFADCTTTEELEAFGKKLKDAYGELPQEINNLFIKRSIEIYLNNTNVFSDFEEFMENSRLTLNSNYANIPNIAKKIERILAPLDDNIQSIRFISRQFVIVLRHSVDYLDNLYYLVKQLVDAYNVKD